MSVSFIIINLERFIDLAAPSIYHLYISPFLEQEEQERLRYCINKKETNISISCSITFSRLSSAIYLTFTKFTNFIKCRFLNGFFLNLGGLLKRSPQEPFKLKLY